jgi:hypothetical protein
MERAEVGQVCGDWNLKRFIVFALGKMKLLNKKDYKGNDFAIQSKKQGKRWQTAKCPTNGCHGKLSRYRKSAQWDEFGVRKT